MKTVKLKQELLIESTVHPVGAIIRIPDDRAADLIALGQAEASEGTVTKTDPGLNPLVEVIQPVPDDGVLASPLDAVLPRVEDYPALQKLETTATTGGPRKAVRVNAKAE